jgi:3-phenylpropionate/trans-cinnamate dioxygenase ferredoxin subunit
MNYVDIAHVDELPEGERLFFDYADIPVVLLNIGGEYFALKDSCTHDDGPLGDGELEEYQMVCPRHGARFDVRSGEALTLPAFEDVPTFPVQVVEEQIQVGFPESE